MWQEIDNTLQAEFTFANFTQAFAFMTEVAFVAEAQGHHPDWTNVYNRVSFRLNTHDAGGIVTDQDRNLAQAIDEIAKRY
ncbi:MAG: 4a-hydroxytetrahydrobiopterin dehydratase [Bacteroidota bacterium]